MAKDKSEKKDRKRKAAEVEAEDVEMADVTESPKKSKKEKKEVEISPEDLSPIAQPLAEKNLLVLAADINPIDIISHLPVLSEEAQIPYIFVASKEELGHASSTKRPTSCVMICPNQKRKTKKEGEDKDKDDDYKELYEECYKEVEKLDNRIAF
ncbi:nucleolar protein family A member 2 [Coprinopsis cinerea okayama7|uniref:Nucleolar protein family A member 2 n=1 Tax=Coprinopsis cinerea (strain Okayama-7 / 130 / ATCC MYA-4618 / FGSC 9003) TaxID=240176 RepID=A8NXH9_COPC7|nr:nucleolar protein family A member 2 [Coprinopsis cinerea okayama7\|eukprot:XP_001837173.2 nucleolar protein family A member 2 [Coprinopsis cinerea okayama7\